MAENKRFQNEEVMEIDLIELFYLFLKKLKFIILMAVIGGLIAGSFTYFFIPPKYQATSQIYIVSASNDSVVNLSDLQIGTNLTQDYKELILARPMMESVIKNLELEDITVDSLKKMIEINNPSGTRIIEITVTSTVPQLSKDIANEMATLAVSWLPEVMESNVPNIVEEAILPTQKSSPSISKNSVIGAMILAMLYFGIVVVKHLFNETFTSSEEMEKYLGMVPLSVIPEDPSLSLLTAEPDDRHFNRRKHKK